MFSARSTSDEPTNISPLTDRFCGGFAESSNLKAIINDSKRGVTASRRRSYKARLKLFEIAGAAGAGARRHWLSVVYAAVCERGSFE